MTISKNRTTTLKVGLAVLLLTPLPLTSCINDAQIASNNLSRAADNFEIMRRVVFLNGITDTYLLSIEGSLLNRGPGPSAGSDVRGRTKVVQEALPSASATT